MSTYFGYFDTAPPTSAAPWMTAAAHPVKQKHARSMSVRPSRRATFIILFKKIALRVKVKQDILLQALALR